MKALLSILFLAAGPFWALAGCSNGGVIAPPTQTVVPTESESAADVQSTIMQLERDWVAAIVNKDGPALDLLLADDFVGTSPNAHTFFKEMAIEDLQSETYVVESMELDEISVNLYGDTAIAFTSQEEHSTYFGEDIGGHYHYTNVWVRRDGQWQVVASHGSRYALTH